MKNFWKQIYRSILLDIAEFSSAIDPVEMARVFIISTTLPQFCYREHTRLIMEQTRVPFLRAHCSTKRERDEEGGATFSLNRSHFGTKCSACTREKNRFDKMLTNLATDLKIILSDLQVFKIFCRALLITFKRLL